MPFELSLTPPAIRRDPQHVGRHGYEVIDPYGWMRDPGYPKVEDHDILTHLDAENSYFGSVMAPLEGLKTTLFDELKGRISDDETSVPQRDGAFVYQWVFEPGAQYRVWKRWPDGDAESSAVILSEPERAKGHDHYVLGALSISPNDELMIISEDISGEERYVARVKSLKTGDFLPDEIAPMRGGVVWSADSKGFFYAELDGGFRTFRIRYHVLGTLQSDDRVIYDEPDSGFFVGVGSTQDRRYLVLSTGDHITSEIRLLDLETPLGAPILIAERRVGVQYSADHGGGYLYLLINDTHENFRLVQTPLDQPGQEHWREIESPSDARYLRSMTPFKDWLVVEERRDGLDQILVRGHSDDRNAHLIAFPEDSYSAGLASNPEYDPGALRLGYQSMITPPTVYDYEVAQRTLTVRKVRPIPSGYDKSRYRTRRLMAPARDGTMVPISIVYREDFEKGNGAPLHLYGYGAYGMGMSPSFSSARLSLLDRGFAYAIAHIRGGDELGYGWYRNGKLMKRWHTFTDFVDCADYLVDAGFAKRGKISISGGSAGGALMGTVLNIGAGRWGAVVAQVPFVDVLNTMLDETLPLTPMEWPEWGNPVEDIAAYALIASYSPYENVRDQAFPPILVTGGLSDPRVTYWEPAKWTARLRDHQKGDAPIVMKMNMGAGHQGKSGRYDALEETAEGYAFLLAAFGKEDDA
ncbi:MAG: S9 family peptidase [Pseudomonadota bacterium]